MTDINNSYEKTILIQSALKSRQIGMYWFVGGLAVTLIGYMQTDPGGSYFIFWGAPLYGLIRMFRAHQLIVALKKLP